MPEVESHQIVKLLENISSRVTEIWENSLSNPWDFYQVEG